jgi:hypothetical protein
MFCGLDGGSESTRPISVGDLSSTTLLRDPPNTHTEMLLLDILDMDQTQSDLLMGLLASGSIRANDKNRATLDLLVRQGLCRLDTPEPIYRLTEKGKLTAGSRAPL